MKPSDPKRLYRYSITLLIIHPSLDPDLITRTLSQAGIEPYYFCQAGKMAYSPKGNEAGVARDTRWNAVYNFYDDERSFFDVLAQMVEKLHAHFKDFFKQITFEGGKVQLIINLPGQYNQGSSVGPETLSMMADMSMALGIEVFPKSNRFDA